MKKDKKEMLGSVTFIRYFDIKATVRVTLCEERLRNRITGNQGASEEGLLKVLWSYEQGINQLLERLGRERIPDQGEIKLVNAPGFRVWSSIKFDPFSMVHEKEKDIDL